MKVSLKSDFRDYYDYMFDRSGVLYERMSETELSRREAFGKMLSMGLNIPPVGTPVVFDEFGFSKLAPKLVIYHDQYRHRGEGKSLVSWTEGYEVYSDKFASIYVCDEHMPATSYRYLRIGNTVVFLKYTSLNDWRSNCGDVQISQEYSLWRDVQDNDPRETPLLAIDFVKSKHDIPFALDWNTSPGLKGTPMQELISASDIVRNIKEWFNDVGGR